VAFENSPKIIFNRLIKIFHKKFDTISFCLIFALRLKRKGELVAQLVEQYTFNVWVLGSSPSQFTKKASLKSGAFFIKTNPAKLPGS
jgi:hypothetical protein